MMNRILSRLSVLAAMYGAFALIGGCAKSEKTNSNEAEQRYLEAWVQEYHPDAQKTDLGIYILEDEEGTGKEYGGEPYVIVNYTVSGTDGQISATSYKKVAQQLGSYEKSYYYGNTTWIAAESQMAAGVEDMLQGMKAGGTRTALIPSWLLTTSRYKKNSKYFEESSDNSTSIYKIELVGFTDNILEVECDSMKVYSEKYMGGIDTTSYGFYYQQLSEPTDTNAFSSDTTIYINYIGRLLNGQVFDTTIKDTAKMYNIYSSSSTYEPVAVSWGESYSDISFSSDDSSSSSSSLITGFQLTLWQMHKYEKGVGMFCSAYGYGSSGSGYTIPAFAPLIFEIELVDEPED